MQCIIQGPVFQPRFAPVILTGSSDSSLDAAYGLKFPGRSGTPVLVRRGTSPMTTGCMPLYADFINKSYPYGGGIAMMSATVPQSRFWILGGASALIASALAAYAVLVGNIADPVHAQEQKATLPYVIGFAVVFAAIIFGLLVPWALRSTHAQRSSITALVCSLLGLLMLLPAFWSGLPVILGAAGIALGQVGHARAQTSGTRTTALAALVIGALAGVLCIAITVAEKFTI